MQLLLAWCCLLHVIVASVFQGVPYDLHALHRANSCLNMVCCRSLPPAVPVLQARCSFVCTPPLLREAVTEAETVTGRALELADACQEVFLAQPLLTRVAVHADGRTAGIVGLEEGDADGGAVLMLTLVEPDHRVKVEVALRLRDMLAHAHPGEP